jgi:hypothetical protein
MINRKPGILIIHHYQKPKTFKERITEICQKILKKR